MKTRHLLWLLAVTVIAACNNKPDTIRAFIPGTYVSSAKGEYSLAEDTLVISLVRDNVYLITRRTAYQAIRDAKLLPKHHKVQRLDGLYDSGKQVIDETTNGRVFSFDPDKHLLQVNQAVYRKIN